MIIKKNKKELKNMHLFFRVIPEYTTKLNRIIKNIPREYKIATTCPDEYCKYFDKWITLEKLLKTHVFIKLNLVPKIKEIEQKVLEWGFNLNE